MKPIKQTYSLGDNSACSDPALKEDFMSYVREEAEERLGCVVSGECIVLSVSCEEVCDLITPCAIIVRGYI